MKTSHTTTPIVQTHKTRTLNLLKQCHLIISLNRLPVFVNSTAKFVYKLYNISVFILLQELDSLRARIAQEEVNVEVDAVRGPELGTVLSELRSQYEGIVHKNKEEAENWYRKKVGFGWGTQPVP